jgi:hypothetical protein
MRAEIALIASVSLSGCAYMSLQRAEETCVEDAKLARGPSGVIRVGTTTEGFRSKSDITVSTDWGKDPEQVFNSCVWRRAGQPPASPLASQPGWRR